jgi:hypothetical protein
VFVRCVAVAAVVVPMLAAPASRSLCAQQSVSSPVATDSAPTARFSGRLVNSIDSTPVRSADIRLLLVDSSKVVRGRRNRDSLDIFIDSSRSRLAVSDSAGNFAIRQLATGHYIMTVRRLGFAPLDGVLAVDTGAVTALMRMEPTSQLLAKVMITEMSVDRAKQRLDRVGFVDRSHSALSGSFIDRAAISKSRHQNLDEVLADYGIHSGDVVLDRIPLDFEDVRGYPADLVLGIEIYRHGRPIEFNGTRGGPNMFAPGGVQNAMRPLIVVWTFLP